MRKKSKNDVGKRLLSTGEGVGRKHERVNHDMDSDAVLVEMQIGGVARRLREEREKAELSQIDLSFMAGLSQNQVNYIETGRRTPNLYTILKLCKALRIDPGVLFETDEYDREREHDRETVIGLVKKYI
jgi:ribosome-binding protein aMBF1 (putative translation factor)